MSNKAAVLLLLGLLACSNPQRSFELGSLSVMVGENGELQIEDGGRPLWAGAGPFEARSFTETIEGELAIYQIERTRERILRFESLVASRREGDAVQLEYASGDATLRLRVGPGANPGTVELSARIEGARVDSIVLPSSCDEAGSFHGFGVQYNGTDQRGEAFSLVVSEQGIGRQPGGIRELSGDAHTTYFPMPYLLDARGHGALLRTDHRVDVDLCATRPDLATLEVVAGEIDWVIFSGPTPADVLRQLSTEVGRPAPPPDWAFGTWISSQGGRDAVLADVAALEANGIPVAAVWSQDWTGVRRNPLGGFGVQYRWREDADHYPELARMIGALHAKGIRFLAYANPFVDPELPDHFQTMAERDWLLEAPDGAPYVFAAPNGESAHPDLTSAEAREYVMGELRRMVEVLGIDGWMVDFGEWTPLDARNQAGIDPAAHHNRFPVDWHALNRAVMEAARPDGDWVLFARSGWRGVQGASMIHWAGDQEASFSGTDGLPTVVPAMINMGLSGVLYPTHDIAGFSGGPSTKELYLRWTELGAFTPVMRTHEGNQRDRNWNWDSDAETTAFFRRFSKVHDALRPELLALRNQAQETGLPMVRHLLLQFGEDREVWSIADQYLLGDALLVAPVTTESTTRREVYLPEGEWFHVWTGESYRGPARVTVDAPIGSPPVFSLARDRPDLRAIQ